MTTRIIEIIIDPQGRSRIETKGFAGSECRDASRFIEQALGRAQTEALTAEFHSAQQRAERQLERQL